MTFVEKLFARREQFEPGVVPAQCCFVTAFVDNRRNEILDIAVGNWAVAHVCVGSLDKAPDTVFRAIRGRYYYRPVCLDAPTNPLIECEKLAGRHERPETSARFFQRQIKGAWRSDIHLSHTGRQRDRVQLRSLESMEF